MKTFAITSCTNYGDAVHIINAKDEEEAREIAKNNEYIWEGYDIEEVDTHTRGIVFGKQEE